MAQAPMRADEAITSTRPNAIRFPRRSRETLARRRAYPQSDATGEDIESPTRPLRLGPQDGPGRIFLTRPVSLHPPPNQIARKGLSGLQTRRNTGKLIVTSHCHFRGSFS